MRKVEFFLLGVILLGAFVVRLYRFDNPIADWHSWRQSDTSAVSRNFVKSGFDLLHPRYDDISKIQTGRKNPEGYRFVEFPLYNFFQAGSFVVFGFLTLEQWGRLVTIVFSLLGIVFLYLIVRRHIDNVAALFAAFFYAFLPFSIYYGRTILPDPAMATAILGGIFFFDLWIEKSIKYKVLSIQYLAFFVLAVVCTASALLLKPFALFFTLPMVYLAYKRFGFAMFKRWQLWAFLVLAILPLVLWRWWIQQYPEGIPASDWLFNGGDIRFKGAFFYWIFADRIGRLILGYWGTALFAIGVLTNSNKHRLRKQGWFFYSFLLSALLYVTVIARGNVQHDYYQILIIPALAIFLGLGSRFLFFPPEEYIHRYVGRIVLFALIAFTFSFSWYFIRDYFNINNRAIVDAGKKADEILPKDALVIAPYGGDTTFLYQSNRKGWPVFDASTEEFLTRGANYLIIANPTEEDYAGFGEQFEHVARGSNYLILKLQ